MKLTKKWIQQPSKSEYHMRKTRRTRIVDGRSSGWFVQHHSTYISQRARSQQNIFLRRSWRDASETHVPHDLTAIRVQSARPLEHGSAEDAIVKIVCDYRRGEQRRNRGGKATQSKCYFPTVRRAAITVDRPYFSRTHDARSFWIPNISNTTFPHFINFLVSVLFVETLFG